MDSGKRWRGQTFDDRSALRRAELLAAGQELLGGGGVNAVTMRAVCRTAGLSPRYFYESFDSREALLVAVYDRVQDGLMERLLTVGPGADPFATVRTLLEACAAYFEEDAGRARILLREPLADDVLRAHSLRRSTDVIDVVGPVLGDEWGAAGTDRSVIATAMSGALVSLYVNWVDGRLDVDRDALADAAAHIVFGLVWAAGKTGRAGDERA
ncbi:TetR/AcrR family transcriptional regulator [Mycobacterium sp. pUA109]|uniref:TetR/AcrR family transcriptional regulator n=1 Tax=Mycobacterium sp. pUA109 TaxID=3238982 RepID=UPI00351B612F